jgi:transcription elongation GreA/GreB family factor
MRTPIRKPDRYLRGKPDPFITEAKFGELKAELERMKKIRPRLAAEVKRLAAMGDFSENAAYQIAKGGLRSLNQRILDTEEQIARAEIIETKKNSQTVCLGNLVTVEAAGKKRTFQILGSSETNPETGIISRSSPLGSALIGRAAGETVKIKLADKTVEYKIIKIE